MKISRVLAAGAAASMVLGITACAGAPVVAPITVEVGDLQGETVKVPLNSLLNINTGDLAVDSYTAEIADTSIAEFVEGVIDAHASYNPGVKPLKVGETEVVLKNEDGGIQNVTFTIEVVPVAAGSGIISTGR